MHRLHSEYLFINILSHILPLLSFQPHQTYKKQKVSLKNGSLSSTNGHANGSSHAENSLHKKLRMD